MLNYQQYYKWPSVDQLLVHLDGERVLVLDDEEREEFNEEQKAAERSVRARKHASNLEEYFERPVADEFQDKLSSLRQAPLLFAFD